MTWTNPIPVSFSTDLLDEANRLAHIIDPDTGGALTFSSERLTPDGRLYAQIPFVADFLPIVERRDPAEWLATMTQLAEARGRAPLTEAEINALCADMQIGDEVQSDEAP